MDKKRRLRVCSMVVMLAIPLIPADGVEVCGQVIQRSRNVSTPRNFQQSPGFSQCTFEIRQSSDCSPDCLARINFHVLLVGAFDGESCTTSSSFMTISEGPHITTGRFCGEVQQERDYFTEFLPAKITFVKGAADDRGVDFAFDVSYMRKSELTVRAGPRPDLYPHVRGDLVTNTFCERVFRDCSRQQACFVQSPGYPGVYPRQLDCRFYISSKEPLVNMYVENVSGKDFDVDGRICDSIGHCPIQSVGQRARCPRDYVKIFDGVDELSPLIGTFCGMGDNFPSSIIGSGRHLFLLFHSDPDGPFLGSGFDLRVGQLPGGSQQALAATKRTGKCNWLFDPDYVDHVSQEGMFLSMQHWYPPGTNCTYLLQGDVHQVVRVRFPSFKISEPVTAAIAGAASTECSETLVLYDDSWPNANRIMKAFCNGFSLPADPDTDFVSSGDSLLVAFFSKTGSYSGSSLQFWAQFDFHDNRRDGEPVPGSRCDELIVTEGYLRSPRNSLVFRGGSEVIRCKYVVRADARLFQRVEVIISSLNFKSSEECGVGCSFHDNKDHLEILDRMSNATVCLSRCADRSYPARIASANPLIEITLILDGKAALSRYFKNPSPLFEAEISFSHPWMCGPHRLQWKDRGTIVFPNRPRDRGFASNVTCIWDLPLASKKAVQLNVESFRFGKPGCRFVSLEFFSPMEGVPFHRNCVSPAAATNATSSFILRPDKMQYEYIEIRFRVVAAVPGRFRLSFNTL